MTLYYIASLNHTHKHHEHIVWWGPNHCGHTSVLGEHTGKYTAGEAAKLNDGRDCLAVPEDVVRDLDAPEPYFKTRKGALIRFYDQRGRVVENSPTNWAILVERHMPSADLVVRKPEVFRGKRRAAFTLPDQGEQA